MRKLKLKCDKHPRIILTTASALFPVCYKQKKLSQKTLVAVLLNIIKTDFLFLPIYYIYDIA